MVMKTLRKVMERLRGRFDFGSLEAREAREEKLAKAKRPPKRKRRR